MKKIGLLTKQLSADKIKDGIKESKGFFVLRYSGLNAANLNILRKDLVALNSKFFITRNRPAIRILKKKEVCKEICESIVGPTAFVFIKDDAVKTAKTLVDFSKENEKLKLDAGILENRILDKTKIIQLASLPSKEILIAQLLQMIKAPISGLVYSLSGIIQKLVIALKEIEKVKKTKGE